MTLTQFKEKLPDITVKIGKKLILPARVSGRKERFATVAWVRDGDSYSIKAAWEVVLRCHLTKTPVHL